MMVVMVGTRINCLLTLLQTKDFEGLTNSRTMLVEIEGLVDITRQGGSMAGVLDLNKICRKGNKVHSKVLWKEG
jgi:hypothetical protein